MKGCICGPVKNCAPYLNRVLDNMEALGACFDDYVVVLYVDPCADGSLDVIKQRQAGNARITFYVNAEPQLAYRTHRIAKARNGLLGLVRSLYPEYEYMLMMDCDDVGAKPARPEALRRALERRDWEALSFNTAPYYDIWGLSIYPYCFSYNHFKNNAGQYGVIQKYVTAKLRALKPGELLECISSFNGAALYRLAAFKDCWYDGRPNAALVGPLLEAHKRAAGSQLVFPNYGNVDARHEDCEHRAFHVQGLRRGARVRITPDILLG